MNAGEIGDQAGRIFQYNIPSDWVYRTQEDQNDFGIDAEIELKDSTGKALGKESVFKVQLKGELKTTRIKKGKYITYSLPLPRLKYYLSFNVPVILVVVDITSEDIFWLSLTDNKELYKIVENSENKTIQVHIPTKNILIRKNSDCFNHLVDVVNKCWNYLSIRGLKNAVNNYQNLSTESIEDVIHNIGDALYKAYHQKLQLLLEHQDFESIYKTSIQMINSDIVPAQDRFIATLYFDYAFNTKPFTKIVREVYDQKTKICIGLIYFAKKDKLVNHRLIAFSKSRVALFRGANEQLFTLHNLDRNPMSDGIGKYVIFTTSNTLYRECCKQLEKIIRLFTRIINRGQFHILTTVFTTLIIPITLFQDVHRKKGNLESIKFLDDWFNNTFNFCLKYSYLCSEELFAIDLYKFNIKCDETQRNLNRKILLDNFPQLLKKFDEIDSSRPDLTQITDFHSITIEEQKEHYIRIAKSLHMDPDDSDCDLGKIVSMAMHNYDPTNIVKNCKHLHVEYRPGGVVAEMLRLHSAGGMHLILCLKHKHITGTGGILFDRYDCDSEEDFLKGFKQTYCDKCADREERETEWKWNLKWQQQQVILHREFLKKIKI